MRRLLLAALLLALAACSNGLPNAPDTFTLDPSGHGALDLPLPEGTVWTLSPAPLTIEPARGVGPARVVFQADTQLAPDAPEVNFELEWSGDLSGPLRLTWPLVRVTGQVTETPPASLTAALPAARLPEPGTASAPQRVIVRYTEPAVAPASASALVRPELRIIESEDPEALLAALAGDPNVLWAELDGEVHALGEPGDEFYPLEWHLRKTGARWAHLESYAEAVTVAIIDTGVRYDHPDLAGRLWGPGDGAYDFVENDDDPTDPGDNHNPGYGSHGTHVTGIVTARAGRNSLPPQCYDASGNPICSESGLVGLTWPAEVKVLPLRVLDENGSGSFSAVAAALRYAAGLPTVWNDVTLTNPHPARVINLSLGATLYSEAMCEAVADATAAGAVVVAAAGNAGGTAYYYPASCAGAVSVGAVDNAPGEPRPTWYTQHNDAVDLSAPGGDTSQDTDGDGYPDGVLSTTWNFETNTPNYAFYMGTSQASPQVAAALALLLAANPGLSGADALAALEAASTDLGEPGRDEFYGQGLLNLPAALGLELPPGSYRVHFQGPTDRWVGTDADGRFSTYLPSGVYALQACRDDSDNGFCDTGEPERSASVSVPGHPTYEVPPEALALP